MPKMYIVQYTHPEYVELLKRRAEASLDMMLDTYTDNYNKPVIDLHCEIKHFEIAGAALLELATVLQHKDDMND